MHSLEMHYYINGIAFPNKAHIFVLFTATMKPQKEEDETDIWESTSTLDSNSSVTLSVFASSTFDQCF